MKNKVLEYIYDTIVNMFNCTFENTNDGITGTDGLYAVSETFDKSLCNILGEDVPDSILQIALDMQTDNLTAVENKLEKMQVLGKTVNQKLISSLARTLEENNNGYLIAEAAFIISGGVTVDCYSAFLAPNSYKLRAWPNQKQMKDIINHPESTLCFLFSSAIDWEFTWIIQSFPPAEYFEQVKSRKQTMTVAGLLSYMRTALPFSKSINVPDKCCAEKAAFPHRQYYTRKEAA